MTNDEKEFYLTERNHITDEEKEMYLILCGWQKIIFGEYECGWESPRGNRYVLISAFKLQKYWDENGGI